MWCFGECRWGDWKEPEGLILAWVPLCANCSAFIISTVDGDYLCTPILTHTHIAPLHQRAKSSMGHNRPIGHRCCFIANYSVCFTNVLLLLALKQFSAPLVGYASALLVQSLFWSLASKKGFLYVRCCCIHPMEKALWGDPTLGRPKLFCYRQEDG